MRFEADGPNIPDELLNARDEGRVVFFCGSGVSRACADLPDFNELTKRVLINLRASKDSDAWKVFEQAGEIEKAANVAGLFSPDRIFSLLERDFTVQDINRAVEQELSTAEDVDLTAHRTMLELSTRSDGAVRLITTNFDTLFEQCDPNVSSRGPVDLPRPDSDDWGIIHLHGRMSGKNLEATPFVLSSRSFGDAYLAGGWAREFVRSVLDNYIAVFVGYTADDPPMRYLLEGLNNNGRRSMPAYAFDPGGDETSLSSWAEKGVHAIAVENGFDALWSTLGAWASRAKDLEAWVDQVIARAENGPRNVAPHEREMFAHVVSNVAGAKKIAFLESPPPAEWLCVFDRRVRFGAPGEQGRLFTDRGPRIDPFELYKLESDPPRLLNDDGLRQTSEVPENAWSAFDVDVSRDRATSANQYAALAGPFSVRPSALQQRLWFLGCWIAKVSHQPAAAWWAARQNGLHPDIKDRIRWNRKDHQNSDAQKTISLAWRLMFEAWEHSEDHNRDVYRFKDSCNKEGWDRTQLWEFERVSAPYLKINPAYYGPAPPDLDADLHVSDLLKFDVAYPTGYNDLDIPDEWLADVVAASRNNLERAAAMEEFQSPWTHICSIEPNPNNEGDGFSRGYGLSGYSLNFLSLFRRLMELNPGQAKMEASRWGAESHVFQRLRIWSSGQVNLTSGKEAAERILFLDDDAFWNSYHERDLLLALQRRWDDFSLRNRSIISKRILRGRKQWKDEKLKEFNRRRAYDVSSRLYWLAQNGCILGFDVDVATAKYRKHTPDWSPEAADAAVEGMDGGGGWVKEDDDASLLLKLPADQVIPKALELMKRRPSRLTERKPFIGLRKEQPQLALDALMHEAGNNNFPHWAWEQFLGWSEKDDPNPLPDDVVSKAVLLLPPQEIAAMAHTVTRWIEDHSSSLMSTDAGLFDDVWNLCLDSLSSEPESMSGGSVRGSAAPEWMTEALNAPTGRLAEALFGGPDTKDRKPQQGFPEGWQRKVERLLALEGDARRLAITTFTQRLNWFYYVAPEWTDQHLLRLMKSDDAVDDHDAAWAGFLSNGKMPTVELFKQLKPELLRLPSPVAKRREGFHLEVLAAFLLIGWAPADDEPQFITDDELATTILNGSDRFRTQMLWLLERWSKEGPARWGAAIQHLFAEVWPRQKKARTPEVAKRMVELLFSQTDRFSDLASQILPLLTSFDSEDVMLPRVTKLGDPIIKNHPDAVIELLEAILPDNPDRWPYGAPEILDALQDGDLMAESRTKLLRLQRVRAGAFV